jgi:hypothetical protein
MDEKMNPETASATGRIASLMRWSTPCSAAAGPAAARLAIARASRDPTPIDLRLILAM